MVKHSVHIVRCDMPEDREQAIIEEIERTWQEDDFEGSSLDLVTTLDAKYGPLWMRRQIMHPNAPFKVAAENNNVMIFSADGEQTYVMIWQTKDPNKKSKGICCC